MGLGLLFSALSGGAKGYGTALAQQKKFDDERSLMEERSRLEEEKQLRIDEITRQRNAAPLNRFTGLMGQEQNVDVPVTAEPVMKTTAEGAKAAGLQDGLVGMTRDQVAAYNDPDMLAQYDRQIAADNKLAQDKVAGQTRKRTSDEVVDATLEKAKTSDPEAYTAAQNIYRQDRQEERNQQRLDAQDARNANQEKYQMRREDRLDAYNAAQIEFMKTRGNKEDVRAEESLAREMRAATSKALDGANADIRSLEKEAADPMMPPEKLAVIKRQLDSARQEATRYRSALAAAGLAGSEGATSPSKPFDPNDFRRRPQNNPQASPANTNTATQPALPPEKSKPYMSPRMPRIEEVSVRGGATRYRNVLTGETFDTKDAALNSLK